MLNGGFQDPPAVDPHKDLALANKPRERERAIAKLLSIYPLTSYNEGNETAGFLKLADEIMKTLPIQARARTGKYGTLSKREAEERVKKNPKRFNQKGWKNVRHRPLKEIREWLDICDSEARRKKRRARIPSWGPPPAPRRGSSQSSGSTMSILFASGAIPETQPRSPSDVSSISGPLVPW
ncbi:MAG: hypothetical protein MMC23_002406 [Stictis urceolatum]|nr:hypothetical protein [Stictis urceolata]